MSGGSLVQPLLASEISLTALSMVAVILRLSARKINGRAFRADDYLIVLALVIVIAMCVSGVVGAAMGYLAADPATLSLGDLSMRTKIYFADVLLSQFALALVKIAVIMFYKFIFVEPGFVFAANVYMGVVVVWLLSTVLSFAFALLPIWQQWHFLIPTTLDQYALFLMIVGATDLTLDVVILCMPLLPLRKLQMTTKNKVSVAAMMALGIFCVVASSVRIYYAEQLISDGANPGVNVEDTLAWTNIWTHIESSTSVIAACLPTLGPLVRGKRRRRTWTDSFQSYIGQA